MTADLLLKHVLILLIIINPLSKIFIFSQLAEGLPTKECVKHAFQSFFAMLIFMLVAIWAGREMLSVIGVHLGDFRIAGGILIFYSGFTLLYEGRVKVDTSSKAFSIVPFGFPIVVGPGALSVIIAFSTDYSSFAYKFYQSLEVIVVALVMLPCFLFARKISNSLPEITIGVINKLTAVILMTIAVGMIRYGILFNIIGVSHINII
jgi:multiple antibiotic resistance protein